MVAGCHGYQAKKVEKVLSRRPKNLEIGLISEHTSFTKV